MPVPELSCLSCKTPSELQIMELQFLEAILNASGGGNVGTNVNLESINAVNVATGCGVSTAGTLRVAQATDCVVTTNATVVNGGGVSAVNIQDGGNSITIDATSLPLPTGASTAALQTQPGVDIGDVTVNNAAGAAAVNIQDGGNSITVDGAVTSTTTSVVPGTGATNLGKAEDSPHVSGDTGVAVWSVANVAQSAFAADGDYIPHAADLAGNSMVVGNIATDGVDAGNPVKIGTVARTTLPAAVADGDRVNTMGNKYGELTTVHAIREMRANQVTTITASTAETTIVTAVASFNLDLYGLIVTNTSATAVNVAIKDATAGTTRLNIAVPANETRGYMLPASDGIKQATANNNWTATVSASVTSIIITALTKQTT